VTRGGAYRAFFDKALQAHLAYGGSLLLSLLAQAVGFGVTIMVWNYALKDRGMATELFAYLALAFMLNFSYNLFLERTVGERIREGLVATDLLKPVDFQLLYLVQSLSDMIFQMLLTALAFLLAAIFLGRAILPAGPEAALGFFVSLHLAFLLQYGICFLFVQGIFVTNSNYGIFASRIALHQAFSGVFAPLAFFPPAFKSVAMALPFHHVVHTPIAIYLGWGKGPELAWLLAQQALWALGLLLLGRLVFHSILRHLAIQGG
jgi:ABC-2 type transport system permease protein